VETAVSKPNIERMFDAFQAFQRNTQQAMRGDPGSWESGIKVARELFKQECVKLGIADAFDWEDETDDAL
jgi:hypothetical protein